MKTIKNTLIIFLFAFFTGISLAKGMNPDVSPNSVLFSDGIELKSKPEINYVQLAPVTPKEADFEDSGLTVSDYIRLLSPSTPAEPDFEEIELPLQTVPDALIPIPPAEADFSM